MMEAMATAPGGTACLSRKYHCSSVIYKHPGGGVKIYRPSFARTPQHPALCRSPRGCLWLWGDVGAEEFPTEDSSQAKTVRVKFTLKKQCLFGQRFLLAGNDPILGQWDPSNAIPLEWSDGHIWTTELDLPVGKSIRYKFLLCTSSGEIKWQPGPDRVLHKTWETANLITASEGWDDAEGQKIVEEKLFISSAENITGNSKSITVDKSQEDIDEEENINSTEVLTNDLVPFLGLSSDEIGRNIPEDKIESTAEIQQEEEEEEEQQPKMTLEKSPDLELEGTLCVDDPVKEKSQLEEAIESDGVIGAFNRFVLSLGFSLPGFS